MSAKPNRGIRTGGKMNPSSKETDLAENTAAPGADLTTNQGLKVVDDQNSLKAGVRGPTLLEDFHLREKITHFDHERIPERVVHARGAGAHGYFQVYEPLTELTKAALFQDPRKKTPVFVRFSTVAGSRGSADTPRDVRGFAVKFYTDEGVWDLTGNNMPVFFIQDAIKFPDFVHAVKPEPNNEIPQAASAHDTFYDFAYLTPEITHMLMWVMSDRAFPRSFSMMEGFGVHTFRLVNAKGKSRFVKFHWKPLKGVHSLVWDEAQQIAGKDADFNRRDLWESIERGDYPQWELGLQIVEEKDEMKFDFDLLDPTKIIPEEQVPVKRVGKLVLNRNPDNFFAEVEQAAFHPGHIVAGIDFTNDPLLQGRLFSYIDTQITRLGQNFAEIPINRPVNPMSNNQRDGKMRIRIDKGRVAYFPNSLGGGMPAHAPENPAAFSSVTERMDGEKVRRRSPSFSDHFSQATLFWNSMAQWEKDHIVAALSFELNMVETIAIREHIVNDLLVNVASELARRVAENIGVKVTAKPKVKPHDRTSAALSMDKPAPSVKGRKVAILAADGIDEADLLEMKNQLTRQGMMVDVIGASARGVKSSSGGVISVDKPAANAPSVLYDAVFVPGGRGAAMLARSRTAMQFVSEAFMHGKPIGAVGEGVELLRSARVPEQTICANDGGRKVSSSQGIVTAAEMGDVGPFVRAFVEAMKKHRHFDRDLNEMAE